MTEEMHGSDRVPDLNIDYERALVGRAKATASTRAKWRSSPSACCSVLENCLTPPTLSERRFFNSQPMNRGRNRSECPCRHIPRLLVEKIPSLFLKHSLKRRLITSTAAYDNCCYWLDLGNNADSGQFVLGQPGNPKNKKIDPRLPTVAELFPEIIDPRVDKKDKLPACSAVEALERQEPFLNQMLAYHALAMLARLFRYGQLTYHGGFETRLNTLP
jgi:hypothetical protein